MPSLSIGGVSIPVSPNGISRPRLEDVDRARAFDNSYRASATGTPKREWHFSTPPVPRATADWYESVLAIITARACSGDILGGSSNLLVRSQEFDNASWAKTAVTVTPDFYTAPDGTLTADKLIETVATSIHRVEQGSTLPSGSPFALSVHACPPRNMVLSLLCADGATEPYAIFSPALGTVVGTGGTVTAGVVAPSNNGFYRFWIAGTNAAGGGTPLARVWVSDGTAAAYLGNGTSNIGAWGAQLEAATAITPYLPTTTAARSTLSISACTEITDWTPVRTASGHAVVIGFVVHEV